MFQPVADNMATIQPLADNVSQPVADNMAEKCIAAATAQVLDEGDEPPLKKQRISADAEKVAEKTPAAGGTATPDSSDSSVGADKDLKKVQKYLSRALEKVQHLRQPLATLSRERKRERNRQYAATQRANKAMRAAGDVYRAVSMRHAGLKPEDVQKAVEGIFTLAAEQLQKNGSFQLAGMLNFKLKVRPATAAKHGVNPFTKQPCVLKAKPASTTVLACPTKELKDKIKSFGSPAASAAEGAPIEGSLVGLRVADADNRGTLLHSTAEEEEAYCQENAAAAAAPLQVSRWRHM